MNHRSGRHFRSVTSTLYLTTGLAFPARVLAQELPPAAPPPAEAEPAAPAEPAPAPGVQPAPETPPPQPAPQPPPAAAATEIPRAAEQPAQAPPAEPFAPPPTIAPPPAAALEEHAKTPTPEIGGHVEAAYHLSLTHPEATDPVPLRSYDAVRGHTFLLHSAHLVVKHALTEAVSAVIEFDGGSDATVNNGGLGLFDVQEAYATVTAPFGLTFTAGKFVTYEGIEVIEGPVNPTVTRGFLYGLAEPFTHIGAKLHQPIGEVVDVGVGVVNGWDLYVDNNDAKTFIFRVGVTPIEQFWFGLSGSYGAERADSNDDRRLSLDLTGAVIPSEMIAINFQANYGKENGVPVDLEDPTAGTVDGSWFGVGLQPVLTVDAFSAGLRFEYFADNDGTRTGAPGTDINVFNLTVAPGYTFDDALLIRAEYRFDKANEPVFPENEDQQHTIAAAVSYMF